jgi:choline dehydrogenase-like flavoprotein
MTRYLVDDQADFVIVGTGAGGATAARVLAEAGFDLALLEEGPHLRREERPAELLTAMAVAVRDFGSQTTAGATPMPVLQGRLVGGSTAINSGIIWRLPADVRESWTREHGLGWLVDEHQQERIFTQIEEELEIEPTSDEVMGDNAHKMAEAARALGLPGKAITRNARRCQGRARCLQGCPSEARQSMDVSYVPRAVAQGARVHALCRATRVLIHGGRAVGVEGDVLHPDTRDKIGRFRVKARLGVIVAAGVVHTPVLLRQSGLRGSVGDHFQAHPGCAVVCRFPEPIGMGHGATQGYEVPLRERGYKLESLALPPEMLATRIPGAGAEWQQRLAELDHYAQWCVQIRMRAEGTVRASWSGKPIIKYEPLPGDLERAREAIALLCRMMFAVGATEVYPGLGRLPEILRSVDEVDLIERAQLERPDFHFMASHLFGTARAGSDPTRSVVSPTLECHSTRDLFVMDASVFPTNLGVNPQHSIMAVVWRAAEALAARHARHVPKSDVTASRALAASG